MGPRAARAVATARRPPRGTGAVLALAAVAAALALAAPAAAPAAPPARGVLVPGESLGGVVLGMSKSEVRRAWGSTFGRCRSCPLETWYFNYRPFEPQGAGVVFRRGQVVRVFTIWSPAGWRTAGGLALGAPESEVTRRQGELPARTCPGYTALLLRGRSGPTTVFYVYDGKLWGFGLIRPRAEPCV